ncbi:B-cell receptor CD22-like, partial [Amblyraja radiata]|uniref:B-cell receptor CD22-like n=1 Tax=Amblyraja radiata TaxID=386614 RepID=UPI001402A6AD
LRTTVEVGTCDYFCTVRNYLGRTESPAQRIDVQYAPINVRITAPTAPPAGENITLRCGSQANPVVNTYSWRKLCGSQSTDLRRDGVEYRLRATVEVGTCDYFCTARNYLGRTESPAQRIDVQYAPRDVSVVWEEDGAVEGEEVTLRCETTGNPPPREYHWRRECFGKEEQLEGRESQLVTSLRLADQRCDYYCLAVNDLGQQESVAKRLRVGWSKQRKIIAGVTPILVLLILIIPLVLYIRHRRKKVDSKSAINTDATNVVYSVVKKIRKPCNMTMYDNVWLADHTHACRPEPQVTVSYWDGVTRNTGQTRLETACAVREREPAVVYSKVCARNRNTEPGGSEDYENVTRLWWQQEGESEGEGEEYSTITHHLSPTS